MLQLQAKADDDVAGWSSATWQPLVYHGMELFEVRAAYCMRMRRADRKAARHTDGNSWHVASFNAQAGCTGTVLRSGAVSKMCFRFEVVIGAS